MINRPNIRAGFTGGGASYDADAQLYFDEVAAEGGTISNTRKQKINDFIVYLRDTSPSGNQWARIASLKILINTSEIAALVDVKQPTAIPLGVAMNSPTFIVDGGYDFNGTTQYLRSGFIPSTHGAGIYQHTNCSIGFHFNNHTDKDYNVLTGASDGVSTAYSGPRTITSGWIYAINDNVPDGYSYVNGNNSGHYLLGRSGGSTKFYAEGNGQNTDGGMAGGGLPTVEFYIGASNNNGVASNFCDTRMQYVVYGSYALDFADFRLAYNTYLA